MLGGQQRAVLEAGGGRLRVAGGGGRELGEDEQLI